MEISSRRRHALVVKDGAFSPKIDILNLKGHLNRSIGSKVTAILVNWEILPSGGVASGKVYACSLRSAQQACFFAKLQIKPKKNQIKPKIWRGTIIG